MYNLFYAVLLILEGSCPVEYFTEGSNAEFSYVHHLLYMPR